MAQTIEEFIAGGDFQIGARDPKSRIAPVTRNGKPILLCLSAKPELTTPFPVWPSYNGGERISVDFRLTPDLERLAEHIDSVVQKQVAANPGQW